ncbi:MAG: hypothetical protein LBG43_01365 [Treponema sp.]|jgi:hypothetical protein|nr:hypothetical protein [Treponema sp.]
MKWTEEPASKDVFAIPVAAFAVVKVFSVLPLALTDGETFNYEGGFSLKHAKEWRQIAQNVSENVYSYRTTNENPEILSITVSNLSKNAKRDMLRDLRDSGKQLKLTAKTTVKSEKEKRNEKQLKKSLRKDKVYLKTRLKEIGRARERTLQANEKHLKSGLEANRQERRKLAGKWFENPSGVFISLK